MFDEDGYYQGTAFLFLEVDNIVAAVDVQLYALAEGGWAGKAWSQESLRPLDEAIRLRGHTGSGGEGALSHRGGRDGYGRDRLALNLAIGERDQRLPDAGVYDVELPDPMELLEDAAYGEVSDLTLYADFRTADVFGLGDPPWAED